ncbi:MAG: HD domain-containing protein [Lachnospiraceae bacterium]|nr:HD domain-containing protein [Lachnospiraceae bacterium]
MWKRHFDVNFTLIFTIVPVTSLGYIFQSTATSIGEALTAVKIIYIGGCYLQMIILLGILRLCRIKVEKWFNVLLYTISSVIYACVLTIGHNDLFYKDASLEMVDGLSVIRKEYGPAHTIFYAMVIIYFLIGIISIAYSWLKKKQVARSVIMLLVIPDLLCMLGFFVGRRVYDKIEFVSLGYVLAQFVFILTVYRVSLYNVSDTVMASMVREREIGYISFDFKYRYLGSNKTAMQIVPEFKELAVDDVFGYRESERKIRHYLDSFDENNAHNQYVYMVHGNEENGEDDRYYNANVNYLYDGHRKRGYIITFTDDTANRKYIQLLDNYNEKLQEEVEEKTEHIVKMHDNLIMSLAMMVESRDNSTGGHIMRTSEGVRILLDEIIKEGNPRLPEEFCKDVVKAAPMHDLGKIAVDDAVLRKPGRFTDEEYDKMKKHAEEGARVIRKILLHTDDASFKTVAENIAHYHHERWDGSGYPEGLSGEQIPIEARIMAIADVYDALVSKRVYKEAFDFKKADSIIMEGMGTQFDPGLKNAYVNARSRLEEYYSSLS